MPGARSDNQPPVDVASAEAIAVNLDCDQTETQIHAVLTFGPGGSQHTLL